MKKLLIAILIFFTSSLSAHAGKIMAFTANSGGATGAMDAWSCDNLATNDLALVYEVASNEMMFYKYNADGGCPGSDTDPYVIEADNCASCSAKGQWELLATFTFAGVTSPSVGLKDSDQANQVIARFQADASDANDSKAQLQVEENTALTTYIELDGTVPQITISKAIVSGSNTYTSTGALKSALPITSISTLPYNIVAADAYGGTFLVTVGSGGATDDVMLPDVCDSATGANVLVAIRDASEQISIAPTDTGDEIIYEGAGIDAGHELDSPASAAGDFIVFECMETGKWYVLGHSGTWTDGGAQD